MVGGCRLLRTSAALALVVIALAGCGGDDEPADSTITAPELTVPGGGDTQESVPTDTEPSPSPAPPPADTTGGSPVPGLPEPEPDSPGNDLPPPPDSPEERFEEFCNANPGACG